MKAKAQITSERLILRPPVHGDELKIFNRYAGDPEVTRYLSWPRHKSISDSKAFIRFSIESWSKWQAGPYLVWNRKDKQLLGSTGFAFESAERISAGYVFAKDSWGKGYATESMLAILEEAIRINVPCLYAFCHPYHKPSRRVLDKCGFIRYSDGDYETEFPNLNHGTRNNAECYRMVLQKTNITG